MVDCFFVWNTYWDGAIQLAGAFEMTESKTFQFFHDGLSHTAYVRYYENGDRDIEILSDSPSDKAYDKAWDVAEELGIM